MSNIVYYISSDKLGNQDPELGKILMGSFFRKLFDAEQLPSHILLVESGVKLLLPEFDAFGVLRELEAEGVKFLACVTCLDYYGIKDKIGLGEVSNMPTIIKTMHDADKVISL
jgi:selenium metabolism protein YedF